MNTLTMLQTLSSNFTIINIVLLVLGTIGYFVMEFKLKAANKQFSILYWMKDNWYNIIFGVVCVVAYFMIQESVSKLEAFALGLAPNLIADWAGNMIEMMKKKTGGANHQP